MEHETFISGYTVPHVDKELLAFAGALNREARKYGAQDGRRKKPSLGETDFTPQVSPFKMAAEHEITRHMGAIKLEVHEATFNHYKQENEKKNEAINEKKAGLIHENELDERELADKTRPESVKRNLFAIALLCLMCLGETYFNSLAFQFFGGGVISCYLLGGVITAVETILAIAIGKSISQVQGDDKKRYVQIAGYALADLGLVIAMSVLRSKIVSDATEIPMPLWVYFCITVGLLAGSFAFAKMLFPSEREQDEKRQLRLRFEKVDQRKNEIEALEKESTTLAELYRKQEEQYLIVKNHAEYIRRRIGASYREAVAHYKAENMRARNDGMPESFKTPIPEIN